MKKENAIFKKINEIIKKIEKKFQPIKITYYYNEKDNDYFIFHNRYDLEFNDEFIEISMRLLKKYFPEMLSEIIIGYNPKIFKKTNILYNKMNYKFNYNFQTNNIKNFIASDNHKRSKVFFVSYLPSSFNIKNNFKNAA